MSMRLMQGCLNMTNSLTDTQNITAETTMLFGQVESMVVNGCINDPTISGTEQEISDLIKALNNTTDPNERQAIEARLQVENQALQLEESTDQQSEQQWDSKTQVAQNQSTMVSTEVQQVVQIDQAAVIAALTYTSNLINGLL